MKTRTEIRIQCLVTMLCLTFLIVNIMRIRQSMEELRQKQTLQVKTLIVHPHPKEPNETAIKRITDKVITHLQQKDKLPGWKGNYN